MMNNNEIKTDKSQKIAVVLGGHSFFDLEIVRRLANNFKGIIYFVTFNLQDALTTIEKLRLTAYYQNKIRLSYLNITNIDCIKEFAAYIKKHYGGIDIMITSEPMQYTRTYLDHKIEALICSTIYFTGIYYYCQHMYPLLRKNARVVNISSRIGNLNEINNEIIQEEILKNRNPSSIDVLRLMHDFLLAHKNETHKSLGYPITPMKFTKLCLNILTMVHQHEFDSKIEYKDMNIVINSYCPGFYLLTKSKNNILINNMRGHVEPVIQLSLLPEDYVGPRGELWAFKEPRVIDWRLKENLINRVRKFPLVLKYSLFKPNDLIAAIINKFNQSQSTTNFYEDSQFDE